MKENISTNNIWVVYILKCRDNTFYTGITNDLSTRLATHNAGKGAKYTRGRIPVRVVYSEKVKNKSEASIREYQIKKMNRTEKTLLIYGR